MPHSCPPGAVKAPGVAVSLAELPREQPVIVTAIPGRGYLITARKGLTAGEVERAVVRVLSATPGALEELLEALGVNGERDPWWDREALVTRDAIRALERLGKLIPWPYG